MWRLVRNIEIGLGAGLLGKLYVVLLLLSALLGITGGIWVVFRGDWYIFFDGLILSCVMVVGWCIVTPLIFPLMGLMSKYTVEENRKGVGITGALLALYQSFWIVVWVAVVFFILLYKARPALPTPWVLWGYGILTFPLQYMARYEDPDHPGTITLLLLAHVGYVLLFILTKYQVSCTFLVSALAFIVAIRVAISTAVALSTMSTSRRTARSANIYEYGDDRNSDN